LDVQLVELKEVLSCIYLFDGSEERLGILEAIEPCYGWDFNWIVFPGIELVKTLLHRA